jgi:hypothetical protein
VATFAAVQFETSGDMYLKAVDGAVTGYSSKSVQTAGAANKISLTQSATTLVACSEVFSIKGQILDQYDNQADASNAKSVAVTVQSGGGTLGGTPAQNTDVNGVFEFNDLTLSSPGSIVVRATCASCGGVSQDTSAITVTSEAAVNILFNSEFATEGDHTYKVSLASKPCANVVVGVAVASGDATINSGASLTFTPANFSTE